MPVGRASRVIFEQRSRKSNFKNAHRAQVEEFLDHNELGVAFEWTVSLTAEHGLALSDDAREHLAAAAAEMHLETNADWQRLQSPG